MKTVANIIDDFGGNTRFAEVIGKQPSTASEMRRRSSIPVEYWPRVVEQAAARGLAGIDYAALVTAHTAEAAA